MFSTPKQDRLIKAHPSKGKQKLERLRCREVCVAALHCMILL